MPSSFTDSGRYATVHASLNGPGDARPTAADIIKDNDMLGQLKDKVIILTGGSNGIGVEEVRALALTGADVVFTSRDLEKGEKVRDVILEQWTEAAVKPRVSVLKMDLQSLASVRGAVEEFEKSHDRLNILVNNAGIGLTPHKLTEDGFEQQFGVNHLAHFYLFELLKSMLLKSTSSSFNSRVISVSSSIHTMASVQVGDYNLEKCGYDPFVGYASSKTCNIWMANELERRYGSKGLHSISVHPGAIYTGLQASHLEEAGKMVEQMIQSSTYIQKSIKSTEQGAASVVVAAIGKEYEGVGGFYMEDCAISPPMPDDAALGTPGYKPWAYDEDGERQLWADSLHLLNLKDDQ